MTTLILDYIHCTNVHIKYALDHVYLTYCIVVNFMIGLSGAYMDKWRSSVRSFVRSFVRMNAWFHVDEALSPAASPRRPVVYEHHDLPRDGRDSQNWQHIINLFLISPIILKN